MFLLSSSSSSSSSSKINECKDGKENLGWVKDTLYSNVSTDSLRKTFCPNVRVKSVPDLFLKTKGIASVAFENSHGESTKRFKKTYSQYVTERT